MLRGWNGWSDDDTLCVLCCEEETDDWDEGVICDGYEGRFHIQWLVDHGIEIPEGAIDSNANWSCVECEAHFDNEGEDGVYA